jgi:hypothetical protein
MVAPDAKPVCTLPYKARSGVAEPFLLAQIEGPRFPSVQGRS